MKKKFTACVIIVIFFHFMPFLWQNVMGFPILQVNASVAPLELQQAIEVKNKALQEITNQLQTTQNSLTQIEGQSKNLKQELSKINYLGRQLDLGIKSSELSIEKLELEISSLQYEIQEAEATISRSKAAISASLQRLYIKEREHLLLTMLKQQTLAQSFAEVEQITNVNKTLVNETTIVTETKIAFIKKLEAQQQKKHAREEERSTLKARKGLVEEQKNDRKTLLAQTKNLEQVYQNQITKLEDQQEIIFDEITKIENELRATFDPSLLPGKRPGVFAWPIILVKNGGVGHITQHQGEQSKLYRGKPHNGLDIGAPQGTPVRAAADGTVIKIDNNDRSKRTKYQYGKYVMIQHHNNLSTLYAHLSINTIVIEGANVQRGDIIGYSGNTGYSTGQHLHFGVYWSASVLFKTIPPATGVVPVGVIINPEDYL